MSAHTLSQPLTALITGGTEGLGRATALLLAANGYRVFAASRNAERRRRLEAEARDRRLPVETLEMDVSADLSIDRALGELSNRAGRIDVLINNAGIAYIAAMEEISLEDLRRQFETNFFGAVRMIQRVLPEMRERHRGRIVNMSSIAGKVVLPLFGPYSASKFALEGMTDALRLEVHHLGIDVVLIEPGYIPTNFQDTSVELSSSYRTAAEMGPYARVYRNFRRSWKKSTSGVRYTPEDCAQVVLKALRDDPPKPRYTVTRNARLASWAKRLLPDRAFDRTLLRRFDLNRQ